MTASSGSLVSRLMSIAGCLLHSAVRARTLLLLLVIITVGGSIRFIGLPMKGLAFYDEGVAHQEGLFAYDMMRTLSRSVWLKLSDFSQHTDRWVCSEQTGLLANHLRGFIPYDAKPLHWGIVALAIAILGNVAVAGPASMALFGTATIPLIYLIGKRLSGVAVGVVSAVLLALNPFHLLYSREGFAEPDSVFFFTLSVCCLLRGWESVRHRRFWLAAAGVVAALSAGAAHRWVILGYLVLVGLVVVSALWRRCTIGAFLGEMLIVTVPYGGMLAAYEVPWYGMMMLFKRCGSVLPYPTYLEQLAQIYSSTFFPAGLSTKSLFSGAYIVWLLAGPFCSITAGCSVAWALLARSGRRFLLVAVWFLIPFAWFSFYSLQFARCLSLVIPAICLLSGSAVVSISEFASAALRLRHRPGLAPFWVALTVVAAAIAGNLPGTVQVLGQTSGYPEAFRILRESGAPKHITSQYFLSSVYLGEQNAMIMPASRSELHEAWKQGYRYYLVDLQIYFGGQAHWPERLRILQEVAAFTRPRWTIENPVGATLQYPLEHNFDWAKTMAFVKKPSDYPNLTKIQIYDLNDYFALQATSP